MSNLISPGQLHAQLGDPQLRIVDVRFDLTDRHAGYRAYQAGHLPGAVYLDLDRDLSTAAPPGEKGGRHPLPPMEHFAARLAALGVGNDAKVVAYDDATGAIASRLWWMLRYAGHDDVRILDGGLRAWRQAGLALDDTPVSYEPATFSLRLRPELVATREEVAAQRSRRGVLLIDARAAERYRGEKEPLDPVAGHIPGAVNLPFAGNLENGHFRSADALRRRFAVCQSASNVIVYCGSGVTACHDALAIEEAGLPLPRLYVGSWSDWAAHEDAPVAIGDEE